MKTLEELIYYCNEKEPVGALMLTGEWGCGKTYFLEHDLKERLKETHILLRISLFGLVSIGDLNECVQNAWLTAYLEDKGWDKQGEFVTKWKERLSKLPLPDDLKNIISFNPATLFNAENKINDKKVILIFDDLERCTLKIVDVLGCINDYCENLNFHTIIVANEEKISSEEQEPASDIAYKEIKEKIIERTIKYKPDYATIVHAVIEKQARLDQNYYDFLIANEINILNLFAASDDNRDINDEEDIFGEKKEMYKQPHNIRSLKCAIQDFYRVYTVLVTSGFSDLDKWLYSFIIYMLAYKANIDATKFGSVDKENPITDYNSKYMFKSVRKWIVNGEWDEKLLEYEINNIKERERAILPKDLVRNNCIIDIDEGIILEGFSSVLVMAYEGQLSLDEYILFISNCYFAREYKFELPLLIDWDKVKLGIQSCINKLMDQRVEELYSRRYIDRQNKELFLPDEWSAYEMIEKFRDNDILVYTNNKNLYLDNIRVDPYTAFFECRYKRMSMFDYEMAEATAKAFSESKNIVKHDFYMYFKEMWQNYKFWPDINIADMVQGFQKLIELLEEEKKIFCEQRKLIAAGHTDKFIEVLKQLIQ